MANVSRQSMPAAKACAFCGQPSPLTQEHIWPRCIIDRTPTYDARYVGKAEKFIEGELTIKDVCAPCNNGPLSNLDAYICTLYDSQFSRIARPREPRTFLYDYPRLLRWLLKASYNAARANQSDVAVLAQYAPFIREGGILPPGVEVRLELIHPSKNPTHKPGSGSWKEIPPQSVRCCRIEVPGNPVPSATVRLVAINSFYFWLLFWPPATETASLRTTLPGTPLQSNAGRVSLFTSRGMLELHADWVANPRASASMKALRARRDG